MFARVILFVFVAKISEAARTGFGKNPQDWGHVDVREGAHMFWWLHYTTADTPKPIDRPLILWLQGGPGASSTGYGNFEILGPLDLNLNDRNVTWIKTHNVLFVDNPVGTGFSYADENKYLATNNSQIARDLIELLRGFYDKLPEFKTVPLHIFGESYGGKMAIEFAHELYQEIQKGDIESNLVAVAMGDSWISPIDSTLSWAPYLLKLGFVDEDGYNIINNFAHRTKRAVGQGKFNKATNLWYQTEIAIIQETKGIDFYNVMYDISYDNFDARAKQLLLDPRSAAYDIMVKRKRMLKLEESKEDPDAKLEKLMQGPVHRALGINDSVVWGSQGRSVFKTLSGDFMKPVVNLVEEVLNNTTLKVVVYNGQLDLICATPGTVKWINKMTWKGSLDYKQASRSGIGVDGNLEGYKRHFGNFSMYWINRAGHMAPLDNPRGMEYVLKEVTNFG